MSFESDFHKLMAKELKRSAGNPSLMADLLELQSRSLGMTVAVIAVGQRAHVDEIVIGVEAYIHGEAIAKLPFAGLLFT